ncbi:LEAF RUST 10 DISEASE-RESISTANCE LOCUS RECEPTOR-LIKE PROTEIN KINASE-like 1.2 isoform X1 [Actinidia eriantha]|uniref:LEAF RUST 10 DISEASE-RESISTANCE LOCUS RECEPTOR-LIKE PROTEIN KINASE-like 1.2 isoform X1 n=1 Tax=Actinidia eriantha TaxID=165200 RepID=UPI0025860061|nr:LEAF RUST 10 DISEASE-RESISTANCE LOCUS RECEPTOR-LIKE PROTEIN KINASE-like 1.2 isoform X1 [Actinidia eriantha]
MHLQIFPTFCVFMIINFIHFPRLFGADNQRYTDCSRSYPCANIPDIPYPFWGGDKPDYCGNPSFELNCQGEAPNITIQSRPYRVLSINNATFTLNVAQEEFWNNNCPAELHNATLDATPFQYAPNTEELMLYYGCRVIATGLPILNRFNCSENQITDTFGIYVPTNLASNTQITSNVNCSNGVSVRVNQTAAEALAGNGSGNITQVLNSGFGLLWEANNTECQICVGSGGQCGTDSSRPGSLVCYCSDEPYLISCNSTKLSSGGGGSPMSIKIVLPIVGAIVAGIGLGCFFFSCRERRKRKAAQSTQDESKDISSIPLSKSLTTPPSNFTRSIPSYPSSKSDFGKASTYFGVQVFSYTELEEATNNFDPSRELGDGGFGTVYYGQLQDGRIVAVKRLYENNFKRVEQFMNEVEILTRLRHDYLVTLFGCTSKRSRELLLVYEYIPNGTVADHLHGKRSNSGLLSLPVRLNIAIETADALAYLHRSDIIHRDVKTNNILLDNDFHVKVADFGLSKLFPNDVTHVSTAPQGTPGYVDPEYYQCYQLTEKSDVYSFGVVLIELISSKQAVDTSRDRLDINLANMAIKKIQNRALHELVDPFLGFETNTSVRRMTTLVAELAFRCLQMERDMRPSMEEILKALRGIKDDGSNAQVDVVDIVIEEDVGILKENPPPVSPPDSAATSNEKSVSNSTAPNSSG